MSRERALLLLVLVAALGLRLAHVFSERSDVLFEHPILDEQRYVDAARALADGRDEDRPYWQPPGIVYVTAAVLRVCGPSLLWPRLLQSLVGTAACLLLYLLARRLFSPTVALAAAALLAFHGVVVHAGGEILPAIWILSLDLLALWLLDLRQALPAGLTLGVSALFSPVILPFTLVAAVWLRKPAAIAVLLAGILIPIVPVTLRNHAHGGEWVLVSTNGGLNLFIGNNQNYRDTFTLRPGRHWEELTDQPRQAGITQPGASSSWFTGQVRHFAAAHPAQAAALYLRKLYLYFNGGEIPRDSDLRGSATVWVWPPFPDGILIPLALAGAVMLWRERRRLALIYAFVALQALLTALFFVSARHRVPSLPLFALLAAAGAPRLRGGWLALPVILLLALNVPVWETSLSLAGESDFYRGVASVRELRDPAAAIEFFQRAQPKDERVWFELGNAYDQLGQKDEAVSAWQRAAAADPWDSRARRRISSSLAKTGDVDGAIAVLHEQLASRLREPAHYAPDYLNLAFLEARRGHLDEARAAWADAQKADPAYFAAHAARMAASLDPAAQKALQGP